MNEKTVNIKLESVLKCNLDNELKILEGVVPWARKDIFENLKNKTLPTSYDDLFQTWQAASFLGLNDFADICSEKMDEKMDELEK